MAKGIPTKPVLLAQVIGNVINNADEEGFSKLRTVNRKHFNEFELHALDAIEDYRTKSKKLPSPEFYVDNLGGANVYDDKYQSDGFDNLYEHMIKTMRELEMIRLGNEIVTEASIGNVYTQSIIDKRIGEMPDMPDDGSFEGLGDEDDEELFEGVDENAVFSMGFGAIDDKIGALSEGQVLALMMHSGMGKTTITTMAGLKAFSEGKKVLYLTTEQAEKEIKRKVYATLGQFNTRWFKSRKGTALNGELKKRKDIAYDRIKEYNSNGGFLKIKKAAGWTIERVYQYMMEYNREHGIQFDLIFIDGFYKLSSGMDSNADSYRGHERNIKLFKEYALGTDELYSFVGVISSQLDPKGSGIENSDVAKSRSFYEDVDYVVTSVNKSKDQHLIDYRTMYIIKNREGQREYEGAFYRIDWDTNTIFFDSSGETASFDNGLYDSPMFNPTSAPIVASLPKTLINSKTYPLTPKAVNMALIYSKNPELLALWDDVLQKFRDNLIQEEDLDDKRNEILEDCDYLY